MQNFALCLSGFILLLPCDGMKTGLQRKTAVFQFVDQQNHKNLPPNTNLMVPPFECIDGILNLYHVLEIVQLLHLGNWNMKQELWNLMRVTIFLWKSEKLFWMSYPTFLLHVPGCIHIFLSRSQLKSLHLEIILVKILIIFQIAFLSLPDLSLEALQQWDTRTNI